MAEILKLMISSANNFRGNPAGNPGTAPLVECEEICCVAGAGIVGDRYFNPGADSKRQITFLDQAVVEAVFAATSAKEVDPRVLRRNVLVAGVDLNALIGQRFMVQGVEFVGVEECAPCFWMDLAIGPGAEAFLENRGGLRAKILSDGTLKQGSACFQVLA